MKIGIYSRKEITKRDLRYPRPDGWRKAPARTAESTLGRERHGGRCAALLLESAKLGQTSKNFLADACPPKDQKSSHDEKEEKIWILNPKLRSRRFSFTREES